MMFMVCDSFIVVFLTALTASFLPDDPPVPDINPLPGVAGDVRLVSDHDQGDLFLLIELREDVHDLRARLGVQVSGRLVRQDQGGIVQQRPGDGDPLLLAAGKLVGLVVRPALQPDRVQGAKGQLRPAP